MTDLHSSGEHSLAKYLSPVLRVCAVGAFAIMLAGLIWAGIVGGYVPAQTPVTGLSMLFSAVYMGTPLWLLNLGLLLLILTPVLGLVTTVILFLAEREWRYALAGLGVLAVLVLSLVVSRV
jgi:uncharacterized membrane protein